MSSNTSEPPRRSTRLSQTSSAHPDRSEARRSTRKVRATAKAQNSVAESSSKPHRSKPSIKPLEKEKRPLKRKRVDDENDDDDVKALKTRCKEVEARCVYLEQLYETCSKELATFRGREQDLLTWEEVRSMSVEERAQQVLKKIENAFTCPLCVDILASPYTITVDAHCGHTFCASCISEFTRPTLHESTKTIRFECPVCRAGVSWGIAAPKPCVLIPNRLAREMILDQLNTLGDILAELPQTDAVTNSTDSKGKSRPKKSSRSKDTVLDWRVGGSLRLDWEKRDREGAELMKGPRRV